MRQHPSKWTGALLLLPLSWNAWAAEPSSSATAPADADTRAAAIAAANVPAITFDLRSSLVRDVVRNTAITHGGSGYRLEASTSARTDADIAVALRVEPAVIRKSPAPRLPERPPPCEGFISCGLETLLGLDDFDEETYDRVQRNRLMNQGTFMDWGRTHSSVTLPLSPHEVQAAGAPLRP